MLSTRVQSFDSLGALEAHLRALLGQYKEISASYREALGDVLRNVGPEQAEKDAWAQEMTSALGRGAKEEPKEGQKKIKLFGEKKKAESSPGWIAFDPLAVRVG